MSDLVAFVRACLDADEQAARAAYDEAGDYRVVGSELAELHFVRWKPDRVLADVAAKRELIRQAEMLAEYVDATREHDAYRYEPTLRRLLIPLAQRYEGEPGWDDAWKVDP